MGTGPEIAGAVLVFLSFFVAPLTENAGTVKSAGDCMVSDVVVVNEGSFVQVSRDTAIGDTWANQPLNFPVIMAYRRNSLRFEQYFFGRPECSIQSLGSKINIRVDFT